MSKRSRLKKKGILPIPDFTGVKMSAPARDNEQQIKNPLEYKVPGADIFSTAEWHRIQPMTDHSSMERDSMRLFIVCGLVTWFAKFHNIKTIGDFGCGNGGLMQMLRHNIPDKEIYGYDFMPANVRYAREQGLDVEYKDIVTERVNYPDLLIMVEVLEHLENPRDFLARVPSGTHLIATVPIWERPDHFSQGHRWIYMEDSFFKMVEESGFIILERGGFQLVQIVMARKK